MNALLCASRVGCLGLLTIAPWLLALGVMANPLRGWACDTAFEVLRVSTRVSRTRVLGHLSQYYHHNGQGVARLNGRLEEAMPGHPPVAHTFHRISEFSFKRTGPYLKKRIDKVVRGMGDTVPTGWALEYFHEPGNDFYLQVMRLGGQARALGSIGMPRLYCNEP